MTVGSLGDREGAVLRTPLCKVRGMITPVEGSSIQFEVWLPPKNAWNGKYVGVGNGAFSGSIMFGEMERPFARGYAVSSTDAGHISTGSDSRWALGRPGARGRLGMASTSSDRDCLEADHRRLLRVTAPKYSYFLGCSKGGASAMMEAQRFPEDYDGIIAGAPGVEPNGADHQLSVDSAGSRGSRRLAVASQPQFAASGCAEKPAPARKGS